MKKFILFKLFKHTIRHLLRIISRITGNGKLPDFVIIGAQKSGTKSVRYYLNQHPEINMVSRESKFFNNDKKFQKGLKWYKSLFYNNNKLQGDDTPEYIASFKSHERMKTIIPNAKLILILRDPVYRAYSGYNHFKQLKNKSSFYLPNDNFVNNILEEQKNNFNKGFIQRGFYIDQIEHLLKFYRREQLLILINEEMRKNPEETYNKIFNFLELKKIKMEFNRIIHSMEYLVEPLTNEAIEIMLKIYKPYNERLYKFLGYEIQDWLK